CFRVSLALRLPIRWVGPPAAWGQDISRTGGGSATVGAVSSGLKPRRNAPRGSRLPGRRAFLVSNQPVIVSQPASASGASSAVRRDKAPATTCGTRVVCVAPERAGSNVQERAGSNVQERAGSNVQELAGSNVQERAGS